MGPQRQGALEHCDGVGEIAGLKAGAPNVVEKIRVVGPKLGCLQHRRDSFGDASRLPQARRRAQ